MKSILKYECHFYVLKAKHLFKILVLPLGTARPIILFYFFKFASSDKLKRELEQKQNRLNRERMSNLSSERSKTWDVYTASNPGPSHSQTGGVGGVDEEVFFHTRIYAAKLSGTALTTNHKTRKCTISSIIVLCV
ncbi:hypothetical protein P8452_11228 [Trifolium repens]|nr:hypothetical protein P8452_11228 [Trifolium repens]